MSSFRSLYHVLGICALLVAAVISFFFADFVLSEFRHAKWAVGRDAWPPVANWLRQASTLMPCVFLLPVFTYLRGAMRPQLNSLWFAIPLGLSLLIYVGYIMLLLLTLHVVQQTYVMKG